MALLKIRKVGDPVLRSKAKEVVKLNAQVIDLLDNMAETMYKAPGAGLAAPQVGVLQRIIVVDVNDENGLIELINPEIIRTSEEQTVLEEGCLSIPGAAYNVIRARQVKVKGLDRKGREIIIEAEGYLARALQHEIDHLDGVLLIDKGIKIPESNQL
ncbi:MAG: peptide deformylase [Halanaerobiales bacterium]|nr:peptide deformylase [Halanaerobiales bacterium]